MMIKAGLANQEHQVMDENMSNLTSASGEASASSGNIYQQSFASPNPTTVRKKRNLPGNPDPDAEVIALSPKTLLATNRFVCEICNKGFQRDQNLQLHRRGHNLPWKLKQRTNKEVKKRVYICPEPSCVHHDSSRALGDLTGIKKHFCRKHGEKKWKCDKCSKRYAVQSDWKAHSKICGTREYRCDCGTLFSRRDSFITHRAFCDALAEESARAITTNPITNPLISSQSNTSSNINLHTQFPHLFNPTTDNTSTSHQNLHSIPLKREQNPQQNQNELPAWLALVGAGPGPPSQHELPSNIFSPTLDLDQIPNDQPSIPHQFHSTSNASTHMSATALLQKAAQMGATISKPSSSSTSSLFRPHQGHHMSIANSFGLGHSSREDIENNFVHELATFGNKAAPLVDHISTNTCVGGSGASTSNTSLLQNMMASFPSGGTSFEGSFDETFGGLLGSKREGNVVENISKTLDRNDEGSSGGGNDGLTRDFLGLRAFSHRDFLNMAGLDHHPCMDSSSYEHGQSQKPWQG